ncbi:MAG: hypothetical protein COB98_03070 [Flavobacteriaceae bacterium]|nr:MAG: hypothetical protein COB98_03070 [Flavobacteriaceae bacterium]
MAGFFFDSGIRNQGIKQKKPPTRGGLYFLKRIKTYAFFKSILHTGQAPSFLYFIGQTNPLIPAYFLVFAPQEAFLALHAVFFAVEAILHSAFLALALASQEAFLVLQAVFFAAEVILHSAFLALAPVAQQDFLVLQAVFFAAEVILHSAFLALAVASQEAFLALHSAFFASEHAAFDFVLQHAFSVLASTSETTASCAEIIETNIILNIADNTIFFILICFISY